MRNRTIAIKVASVLAGGTKQQFYADLRKTLDLSRRVANLSITECLRQDNMQEEKCAKLYTAMAVSRMLDVKTTITSSICRSAEGKYKQERWQVARGLKSLPQYRSWPWPLLCNASSSWLKIRDHGEYLTAEIKLIGQWWLVRLAGGSSHRDQVRGIRQALESTSTPVGEKKLRGKARPVFGGIGDSRIWIDRKHHAVIGVAVRLSDVKESDLVGTLTVSTMRDEFIVATKQRNSTPFTVTGTKVKKWIRERDRRYQALRQDRKSGVTRSVLSKSLRAVGDKWNRRLDSYTHEVSSQLVEHARRRRVKTLNLDMTVKTFMPSFPYFDLASKLAYKCEDAGIEFVNSTQAVAQPDVEKPHVYFKYAPTVDRVKIGKTSRNDGGRHGSETDSAEELVILAVDNQPKTKLTAREKHHHSMFAKHRVKGEWFAAEPVITWLREAGWLGNAGNLSQLTQVMEM